MAVGVNIGELDRRISIYAPTETVSDTGEVTRTYTKVKDCFAKVEFSNGTESISTDKPTVKKDLIFTIRYISTLDETYRITYKNTDYNVTYIEEVERKVFQRVTAEKPDNE